MCSAQELYRAAQRMEDNNKFSRNDAQRVKKIAKALASGDANPQELAWAKRVSRGLLDKPCR